MQLLTVSDVATMCRVSGKTVTRAIGRGELRAVRLGARGAYRLRADDVEAWLAACEIVTARGFAGGPDSARVARPARGWLTA